MCLSAVVTCFFFFSRAGGFFYDFGGVLGPVVFVYPLYDPMARPVLPDFSSDDPKKKKEVDNGETYPQMQDLWDRCRTVWGHWGGDLCLGRSGLESFFFPDMMNSLLPT